MAHARVDATGLACPLPVVKARLEIDRLQPGQLLEVVATDPGSKADFASWTKMAGHELVSTDEAEGVFTYVIRRG